MIKKQKLKYMTADKWFEYYKLVSEGKFFEDVNILKIANKNGWTIAHEQAKRGWTTENEEILCLADYKGISVAHVQAKKGWTTNNKKILQLADFFGITVAHYQVLFNKQWETHDKDILRIADRRKWSVAHALAYDRSNWYTDDPDILALTNINNLSVLTLQIQKGYIPDLSNPEVKKVFEQHLKKNFFTLIEFYKNNPYKIPYNLNKLYNFLTYCQNYYSEIIDFSNIPLIEEINCKIHLYRYLLKRLKALLK